MNVGKNTIVGITRGLIMAMEIGKSIRKGKEEKLTFNYENK